MCDNDTENLSAHQNGFGPADEITPASLASALLSEFQERFLAGGDPDPKVYLAAYTGPDREDFGNMLAVCHLLLREGCARRRQKRAHQDV